MKTYYQYFHFMSCAVSIVKALQKHQNQQSSERQTLYKHQKKCYATPKKYLSMIIDGIEQKKTLLPHFVCTPKSLQENFIQFHLVDCMVLMKKMCPRVYFIALNIHNDANLTIAIIYHVLIHWYDNLPKVLYLQLDSYS
jgi:hypothetical protein